MSKVIVHSVEDAVIEAKRLASTGKKYWFRGQTRDWEVQSTYLRTKESERDSENDKLYT